MPDAEDKKDETSKADKADTSEASDKSATPTVGQRATGIAKGLSAALFTNEKPPESAKKQPKLVPDAKDPNLLVPEKPVTNTRINRYITTASFFIWLFVISVEIWLIVNTVQAYQNRDERIRGSEHSSGSVAAGEVASNMSASTVAASPIPTFATSTVQKVPWATKRALAVKHESLSAIHFDNGTSIETLFMHPVLHKRALSQSYSTFEELPAKCLYIPGSQLPDKGMVALVIVILYQIWTIIICFAILAFEQRVLRYNRASHEAFFVGLIEGWLGIDILVRGVELQVQLASAFVIFTAACNVACGASATYRERETLLWMIFSIRNWGTKMDGAVGDMRDTMAILVERRAEAEKRAAAEGKKVEDIAPKTLAGRKLAEADLKPAAPIQAYLTKPELLQGKSTADANAEYDKIPEAARNAIPGGVFDPSKRVIGQQEIMSRLMFDSLGAGNQSGGTAAAGGAASGMEKMMTMMMMNQMMNSGGGVLGGGPQQQQPGGFVPGGQGMYGQPAYGQPPRGPTAPYGYPQQPAPAIYPGGAAVEDNALSRFYAKEAAKQAQRQQQGWY